MGLMNPGSGHPGKGRQRVVAMPVRVTLGVLIHAINMRAGNVAFHYLQQSKKQSAISLGNAGRFTLETYRDFPRCQSLDSSW
jgi:hypothetical protein